MLSKDSDKESKREQEILSGVRPVIEEGTGVKLLHSLTPLLGKLTDKSVRTLQLKDHSHPQGHHPLKGGLERRNYRLAPLNTSNAMSTGFKRRKSKDGSKGLQL